VVRHGDLTERGCSEPRRDARDDLEGDPGVAQRLRFVPAASEDQRVAALQPHDRLALARFGEHQRGDLTRSQRTAGAMVAQADQLGVSTGMFQRGGVGEVVVQDDVGLPETLDGAKRDQAEVPRSCAHQVHASGSRGRFRGHDDRAISRSIAPKSAC
jgi:hypothetical protein